MNQSTSTKQAGKQRAEASTPSGPSYARSTAAADSKRLPQKVTTCPKRTPAARNAAGGPVSTSISSSTGSLASSSSIKAPSTIETPISLSSHNANNIALSLPSSSLRPCVRVEEPTLLSSHSVAMIPYPEYLEAERRIAHEKLIQQEKEGEERLERMEQDHKRHQDNLNHKSEENGRLEKALGGAIQALGDARNDLRLAKEEIIKIKDADKEAYNATVQRQEKQNHELQVQLFTIRSYLKNLDERLERGSKAANEEPHKQLQRLEQAQVDKLQQAAHSWNTGQTQAPILLPQMSQVADDTAAAAVERVEGVLSDELIQMLAQRHRSSLAPRRSEHEFHVWRRDTRLNPYFAYQYPLERALKLELEFDLAWNDLDIAREERDIARLERDFARHELDELGKVIRELRRKADRYDALVETKRAHEEKIRELEKDRDSFKSENVECIEDIQKLKRELGANQQGMLAMKRESAKLQHAVSEQTGDIEQLRRDIDKAHEAAEGAERSLVKKATENERLTAENRRLQEQRDRALAALEQQRRTLGERSSQLIAIGNIHAATLQENECLRLSLCQSDTRAALATDQEHEIRGLEHEVEHSKKIIRQLRSENDSLKFIPVVLLDDIHNILRQDTTTVDLVTRQPPPGAAPSPPRTGLLPPEVSCPPHPESIPMPLNTINRPTREGYDLYIKRRRADRRNAWIGTPRSNKRLCIRSRDDEGIHEGRQARGPRQCHRLKGWDSKPEAGG